VEMVKNTKKQLLKQLAKTDKQKKKKDRKK